MLTKLGTKKNVAIPHQNLKERHGTSWWAGRPRPVFSAN